MDISLITSLYRASDHLPRYIKAVQNTVQQLTLDSQIVIIANDATPQEQDLLKQLTSHDNLHITIRHVARESVYASWNRGVELAQADIIGFWNVDDVRHAPALQEGHSVLIAGQAELIDFPIVWLTDDGEHYSSTHYRQDLLAPKTGLGPFFMFHRSLYHRTGSFNPNFRITGDFEWSKRASVRDCSYLPSDTLGGNFTLHGDNLSGGTNPLEWVEFNIALIWHGGTHLLRPVDPDLMREAWHTWGHHGAALSDDLADWLWGIGAQDRYQTYQRERNQPAWIRRIRLALARRGLLNSVEWDVHRKEI